MEKPVTSDNNTKDKNDEIFFPLLDINNKNKSVLTINSEKNEYLFNITEFILEKNYTLENALEILLSNIITKEAIKDKEIGMNDNELFTCLEILNRINTNKNIILKFFNFYPRGIFAEDYFSINEPNYEKFLEDIKIDDAIYKNKLIIIPLNIYNHYSLILIYNKKTYILDFGLSLIIDEQSHELKKNINNFEDNISKFIIDKNYNNDKVWKIIDNDESIENNENSNEKLKTIIKDEDQDEFFNLLTKYKSEINKSKSIKILKYNPILDIDIFKNEDLIKNINILNKFCIQGSQGCGYFCISAFKFIISLKNNVEELLNLFTDSIFQIKVLKILCDELIQDELKIFLINEKIPKDGYIVYIKNENKIAIKKDVEKLCFKNFTKNNISFDINLLIDLNTISQMLLYQGYKIK